MAKNVFREVTVNFCPPNSDQFISVHVDICAKFEESSSPTTSISAQMVLNACYTSTGNGRASVRKQCKTHAAHCECRQAETESHYFTRVSLMNLQVSLTLCFYRTGGLKADIKEPTRGEQNLYWNGDERRVRGKLPAASHTLWSLIVNVRQMFRSLMWIYVDVRRWLHFINLSRASASHPLYI